MKKILLVYSSLIIAVIILALSRSENINLSNINIGGKKSTAQINDKTFNLILAKTDKDRTKGLSGRNKLGENSGMFFIFDKKDQHVFWMRDMKFPIDIIFIDDDKIVDIVENAKAPQKNQNLSELERYMSREKANYVLEINAGLSKKNNIKVGDKVKLENVK